MPPRYHEGDLRLSLLKMPWTCRGGIRRLLDALERSGDGDRRRERGQQPCPRRVPRLFGRTLAAKKYRSLLEMPWNGLRPPRCRDVAVHRGRSPAVCTQVHAWALVWDRHGSPDEGDRRLPARRRHGLDPVADELRTLTLFEGSDEDTDRVQAWVRRHRPMQRPRSWVERPAGDRSALKSLPDLAIARTKNAERG